MRALTIALAAIWTALATLALVAMLVVPRAAEQSPVSRALAGGNQGALAQTLSPSR